MDFSNLDLNSLLTMLFGSIDFIALLTLGLKLLSSKLKQHAIDQSIKEATAEEIVQIKQESLENEKAFKQECIAIMEQFIANATETFEKYKKEKAEEIDQEAEDINALMEEAKAQLGCDE